MSSKHRALLAEKINSKIKQSDKEEYLSDDNDEPEEAIAPSFAVLSDAGDSASDDDCVKSSSSESDNGYHSSESAVKTSSSRRVSSTSKVMSLAKDNDDNLFLDSVIGETSKDGDAYKGAIENSTDLFLAVNPKWLDVDDVMRRRFGGRNVGADEEPATEDRRRRSHQSRGPNRHKSSLHNRRHVFGNAKEDWPRPVTFVCGGMSVQQTPPPPGTASPHTVWFRYHWSGEYTRLQQSFEVVRNTGDVNMLALFLARHPHHLEATVQLGMVFARTGHMDRAADLIRRCLYYLESAHTEAFRPYVALEGGTGGEEDSRGRGVSAAVRCRMDCDDRQNRVLFTALFRHVQMVSMLGCPSVAADVGRSLLSLDPGRDPMQMLLFLDHFLLLAGREGETEGFCSSQAAETLCLPRRQTEPKRRAPAGDSSSRDVHSGKGRYLLDELLPSWALSRSLAKLLQEAKQRREGSAVWSTAGRKLNSGEEVSPNQLGAVDLLRTCLERFPYVLPFIVSSSSHVLASAVSSGGGRGWLLGGGGGADGQVVSFSSWRQVLDHPFFKCFSTLSR
jgi:hypothetical protein